MNLQERPICFGHVVRLVAEPAAGVSADKQPLGFFQARGKTETQVLVVPPVKDEAMDRFNEAEFIIAPIAGEKPQPNGTPLTYKTPFVLRTSDGTMGSAYSLNNKLQRDTVGLALSETKGEMYLEIQRDGFTAESGVHNLDKDLTLKVVDSNRNRKTFNLPLTKVAKPKNEVQGGFVTCGTGQPLSLHIELVLGDNGEVKTETPTYVKNPKPPRRSSTLSALGPQKMEELSRVSRVNSSEGSEMDSPSRSSSLRGVSSNPASPRAEAEAVVSPPVADPVVQEATLTPLPSNSENSSLEAEAESDADSSGVSAPVDAPVFGPENRPDAELEVEGPVFGPENRPDAVLATEGPVFGPMEKPADYQKPTMDKMSTVSLSTPESPTKKAVVAKQQETENLEALKAEAEQDGVDPSCAAKCTVM